MIACLQPIIDGWFLLEPALFAAFFTHKVVENTSLSIPFRVGEMRLECNPSLLDDMCEGEVEARLRYEMIRILLGHPYQRRPIGAHGELLTLASNCTIWGNYPSTKYLGCANMGLARGLCFEEYYALLQELMMSTSVGEGGEETADRCDESDACDAPGEGEESPNGEGDEESGGEMNLPSLTDDSDGDGGMSKGADGGISKGADGGNGRKSAVLTSKLSEASALWQEDELAQEEIRQTIRGLSQSDSWGTLPENIVETIKSTLVVKVDYRKILSLFRASILSTNRHLTRMLPSRRYGFEFMGSKRDFATSLLVAVDVSGSVDTKQVEVALVVINRAFKYGIQRIDVVQFDTELKGPVVVLSKAARTLAIEGRGGTCFQPVIDYYAKSPCDGLLIITDGYAPAPTLPARFAKRVLWMLYNDSAYRSADRYTLPSELNWIASTPRYKYLILPPPSSV